MEIKKSLSGKEVLIDSYQGYLKKSTLTDRIIPFYPKDQATLESKGRGYRLVA